MTKFRTLAAVAALALVSTGVVAQTEASAQTTHRETISKVEFNEEARKYADRDGNGELNSQEYEAYRKLTAHFNMATQAERDALFAQVDKDKNGEISETEFNEM